MQAPPCPTPELLPLADLRGGARARDIALVATDVDGTLTRRGKLDPAVMAAISALNEAGIRVIPVSGRPTGEVLGLCRYLPGVARGLAENGLLEVIPDRPPRWLGRPTDKARLRAVGAALNAEMGAGLRLTGDDFCRLGDVAYERDGREEGELLRLRAAAEAHGVHLVWSNVHVHLAEAIPDKGAALLQLVAELEIDPARVVTIGDAPNDAGLFTRGRFGLTVGTADVRHQRAYFPALPEFVSAEAEGAGFVELATILLGR
jgi:predicted mannosyl-3-phosphoglycerate phosphatase (HAD superfamily)